MVHNTIVVLSQSVEQRVQANDIREEIKILDSMGLEETILFKFSVIAFFDKTSRAWFIDMKNYSIEVS